MALLVVAPKILVYKFSLKLMILLASISISVQPRWAPQDINIYKGQLPLCTIKLSTMVLILQKFIT